MNPNQLKTSELSYALKIRTIYHSSTVKTKRKILRDNVNRSFHEGHVAPFTHEEAVTQIIIILHDLRLT